MDPYLLQLVNRVTDACERYCHLVLAVVLLVLVFFGNAIIGEPRMERRIEALEVPPCTHCTPGQGEYPVYVAPDIPVTSIPWVEGWFCNKTPDGLCLD